MFFIENGRFPNLVSAAPFGKETALEAGPKKLAHLLIVDDEAGMLSLLSELLVSEGYQVTTCQSAGSAWNLLKNQNLRYDLVLSDLNMPQMSGLDLLKKVNEMGVKIPFILMTAFGSKETSNAAFQNGAFGYVVKPFSLSELNQLIKSAIGKNGN